MPQRPTSVWTWWYPYQFACLRKSPGSSENGKTMVLAPHKRTSILFLKIHGPTSLTLTKFLSSSSESSLQRSFAFGLLGLSFMIQFEWVLLSWLSPMFEQVLPSLAPSDVYHLGISSAKILIGQFSWDPLCSNTHPWRFLFMIFQLLTPALLN